MEFPWDLFYSTCLQVMSTEVVKFAVAMRLFKTVRKRAVCKELQKDEIEILDNKMADEFSVDKYKEERGKNDPCFIKEVEKTDHRHEAPHVMTEFHETISSVLNCSQTANHC